MKIVYDSILEKKDEGYVNFLSKKCGITFDTARLLYCRKIDTVEKIKGFLYPSPKQFNDPFLFSNMREAVEEIEKAKLNNQKVLVYGDYDADGVSATAVLYYALKDFGINADCMIPEREEGYGLNEEKILSLSNKPDLVITVDCGISDGEKIKNLKNQGINVIVTDHHEPPVDLPDCIKINPKLEDSGYPFKGLCGAGVAYKLGYALIGEKADKYLDFVALATVSDSMDLVEENRSLVIEGLKLFNSEFIRPQFKFLIGETGKTVSAHTLAFSIAPKINAGGRMGDANTALKLFLSEKISEIAEISEKLKSYNTFRQIECEEIYQSAKSKILNSSAIYDDVITVYDESWKTGFIGIVAAKLVEDFSRPVIVFGSHDGILKGSARSVDGINIHKIISSCEDMLVSFGGHAQAAGVSVEKENFNKLNKRLNAFVKENIKGVDFSKTVHAEWEIKGEISQKFVKELELLEPYGTGNKRPLFGVKVEKVQSNPLKKGSPHYAFSTHVLEMLDFNGESHVETLMLPIEKTVVFETNVSTFKNRTSIKGFVRDVVPDFSNLDNVYLQTIESELDKCINCNHDVNVKDYKDFDDSIGKTLYAISSIDTLENYKELKSLPLSLFRPEKGTFGDQVVVSLREIPEGYNKVVYLDNPLCFICANVESYCNFSILGYNYINEINPERTEMANGYKKLLRLNGKTFNGFSELIKDEEDKINALFQAKVFTELGIFKIKDGIFILDETVKSELTNSKIYNRIIKIKG